MRPIPVPLQRLRPNAIEPAYQTPAASGLDLHACLEAPITLAPGARAQVPTGWALALPEGLEGQVRPRSGLAWRSGLTVLNAPGTIDADYRGELTILVVNLGTEPVTLEPGDRIAQLVVAPVARIGWEIADTLPGSARGTGGFGHTGR